MQFRFLGFEISVRRPALVTPPAPPVPPSLFYVRRGERRSLSELKEQAGGIARLVEHLGGDHLRRWLGAALGGLLPGKIAVLVGPPGCGKSTLINALRGMSHNLCLVDGGDFKRGGRSAVLCTANDASAVSEGALVFECLEPWCHAFDRSDTDAFVAWLMYGFGEVIG